MENIFKKKDIQIGHMIISMVMHHHNTLIPLNLLHMDSSSGCWAFTFQPVPTKLVPHNQSPVWLVVFLGHDPLVEQA